MSQAILDKYRDVVVANANHIVLEISLDLKNRPLAEQREAFAGEVQSGFFYLHRIPKYDEAVFECVVSGTGDAISSAYINHPIFNTVGDLLKARRELVFAIAEKVGLSVEAVGVDDPGRGRQLGLNELSTGQLIDMLADRVGHSIIVTNNHSARGVGSLE